MKTPSFFCENCNKEVEAGMDNCPYCGRKFSSVRCPRCGFSGNSDCFIKGCQKCGYGVVLDSPEGISPIHRKQIPTWIYMFLIGLLFLTLLGLLRACFLL